MKSNTPNSSVIALRFPEPQTGDFQGPKAMASHQPFHVEDLIMPRIALFFTLHFIGHCTSCQIYGYDIRFTPALCSKTNLERKPSVLREANFARSVFLCGHSSSYADAVDADDDDDRDDRHYKNTLTHTDCTKSGFG